MLDSLSFSGSNVRAYAINMRYSSLATILFSAGLTAARPLTARGLINDAAGQTFDYIVVGCGVSGLVVSSRLSENEDVTVLCLEAGAL